jgi:Protein of unknown function (DUF3027)
MSAVKIDALAADAIDEARRAAETSAGSPDLVGEHVGVQADDERVVTHLFRCADPAYRGWTWAVTVARASRARTVTVDEVVLLPGSDALLAPAWVPWSERIRPGDLGPGDLLPTPADDVRLVPAALLDDTDDWAAWDAGRARTLSVTGRDQAAERWYADRSGPAVELARLAPAACATCGFFVPLAGDLGQLFGACANAFAPDDARVVAADHGCGAHSEVVAVAPEDVVAAPVVRSEYVDVEEIPDLVEARVDQVDEAAASADPATSEAAEVSGLADGAASNESHQMAAPSTESADSAPVVELDTPETNERETDEPVAHIGDDVPGETGDDTSALADGDGDSPR